MTRSASAISRLRVGDELQRSPASRGQQPPGDRRGGLQPLLARSGPPRTAGRSSIATPAVAASALASSSSSALNSPRGALGEVEVAEHLVPDPDRHAQEAAHRRVPGGKPEERGSSAMVAAGSAGGRRSARRAGPCPAAGARSVPAISAGIPTWTNSASPPSGAITPSAAYRAPTSSRAASAIRRSTTGSARSRLMIWLARSRPAQPALGAHHLLRPLDQLAQQLIELQPRQLRKHQHLIRWSADTVHPAVALAGSRTGVTGRRSCL